MTSFEVPSELLPTHYQAPRLRLHVLRAATSEHSLWSLLTRAIARSRNCSDPERQALGENLKAWAASWRGTETTPEEWRWFEALVGLACQWVLPGGSFSPTGSAGEPDEALVAELAVYRRLLEEDVSGGGRPPRSRSVRVPVAFIPGREDIDPPTVALLELRLVPGPNELHVHPADRWRRDVSVTVRLRRKVPGHALEGGPQHSEIQSTHTIAGSAQPDFIASISSAIDLARAYHGGKRESRDGTVVWRLLDVHNDEEPCSLQGTLQGPSAGGAALRGALHLLGPGDATIPPRIFVLAQLGRDSAGVANGMLEPVRGERAKMIAIAASMPDAEPGHRLHALIVLSRKISPAEIPPEIDSQELSATPVRTVEDLARHFTARDRTRVRLGSTPEKLIGLNKAHKYTRLTLLALALAAAAGGAWLYHVQNAALASMKQEFLGDTGAPDGSLEQELASKTNELVAAGDYAGAAAFLTGALENDGNIPSDAEARLAQSLAAIHVEIARRNPAKQALEHLTRALVELRFANTALDEPIPTDLKAGLGLYSGEILRLAAEYYTGQQKLNLLTESREELDNIERMPGKSLRLEQLTSAQLLLTNADMATVADTPEWKAQLAIIPQLMVALLGQRQEIPDQHLRLAIQIKLAQLALAGHAEIDRATILRYLEDKNDSGSERSHQDTFQLKIWMGLYIVTSTAQSTNASEIERGLAHIKEAQHYFANEKILRYADEADYALATAYIYCYRHHPGMHTGQILKKAAALLTNLHQRAATMPEAYAPLITEGLAECEALEAGSR